MDGTETGFSKAWSLGCALLVILVLLGLAAAVGIHWGDGPDSSDDEIAALTSALEQEFGHPPVVDLVCVYPVVGVGPCVPGRGGSREVALTFEDYALPPASSAQEHARRIARFAHESSAFATESDKTVVVFHEGDEWASVTRRYSFEVTDLARAAPP